ncbi:aldose epimerase family protein [Croceiramulus getboli]|nr:galactose mutarotase [Flavobacteriaceae bacterium YJPT1-3]
MITSYPFGTTSSGQEVTCYIFRYPSGMEIHLLDYGLTIHKLLIPQEDGKFRDVVLGFDELSSYEQTHPYFGCIIGRYANRIKEGQFEWKGEQFRLSRNDGSNHLHGGPQGFHRQLWTLHEKLEEGLVFTYTSPDGEEGFPGDLQVEVRIQMTADNRIRFDHFASTTKDTPVNLTRHEYWNLDQRSGKSIEDHQVSIRAEHYLEVDKEGIPTGAIKRVDEMMNFTSLKAINTGRKEGYDHNYVIKQDALEVPIARITKPDHSITMQLFSNSPGLQFFTANNLGSWEGKYGALADRSPGLCLEPQHFPDAPNHPNFPGPFLLEGDTFHQIIIYAFEF